MGDESSSAGARIGFHVSAFGSHQVLAALSALSRNGFEGLEIYADTTHIFAEDPGEFRTILGITSMELAGVHAGGLLTSPEFREAETAEWQRLVEWTAAAGGSYAIFYGGESHGTPAEDLDRAASFLDEIGAYAAERGVRFCYEPDRTCPFATRERIGALMQRTTPGRVWLSADTAHLTRMGLDPCLFLVTQRARIGVVHFRDLAADPAAGDTPFTEIGQGTIDFPSVTDTLATTGFDGWIVGVVDRPTRSGAESVAAAAAYLRDQVGLAVG